MEEATVSLRLLFTEPNYKKYKLVSNDCDNIQDNYTFDLRGNPKTPKIKLINVVK